MSHSNYNKNLKHFARKLRNNNTPSEIKLWKEVLRARNFYGLQFNRQFPIDRYIADFICRKIKLIIELDVRYHELRAKEDKIRDDRLKSLGYHMLRIPEYEVMTDLQNVIRTIEAHLPYEIVNQ